MFGIATDESIPPEYLTDHTAWDRYIGSLWHDLLQEIGFDPAGTVVEIAPGASIKIAAALERSKFHGKLFVVDASPSVIDALRPRYAELLPAADIHWIAKPVAEAMDALPDNIDALLASHVIDDMLLFDDGGAETTNWAASYTHAPDGITRQSWEKLSGCPEKLVRAQKNTAKTLQDLLRQISPKQAIFSQYPSSTLKDNGLGGLNDAAIKVLDGIAGHDTPRMRIQEILSRNKHYNNRHMGEHVLNARYWRVMTAEKR